MGVFRSWDEDDDEYEARSLVRELIPGPLRDPVRKWVKEELHPYGSYEYARIDRVHEVQSALQVVFHRTSDYVEAAAIVRQITERGDQFLARVVDFFLSSYEPSQFPDRLNRVDFLSWHFDSAASAAEIAIQDGCYRLKRRVIDGAEELAEESRRSTHQQAGRHLQKAWTAAYAIDPDPSVAMSEAIKAVEAAAHPVVTPRDKQVRLGKIVAALKEQQGWSLTFRRRDDGRPDHRATLIGMLETLAFAQEDRHGGTPSDIAGAQAHVQLASVLVQWFSTGTVVREQSS